MIIEIDDKIYRPKEIYVYSDNSLRLDSWLIRSPYICNKILQKYFDLPVRRRKDVKGYYKNTKIVVFANIRHAANTWHQELEVIGKFGLNDTGKITYFIENEKNVKRRLNKCKICGNTTYSGYYICSKQCNIEFNNKYGEQICKEYQNGKSVREIMRDYEISERMVYKIIRRYNAKKPGVIGKYGKQIAKFLDDYKNKKINRDEIQRKVGCGMPYIIKFIKEHGIEIWDKKKSAK